MAPSPSPTAAAARAGAGGPDVGPAARTDPVRLAAVRATGLLDAPAEEAFDRLTRLAVRLVGVPAAFVSLVDAERDFYLSSCGFPQSLAEARQLAGLTFCHHTVQRAGPLVIPDTAADPVYRAVPTVRTMGVAAYVGVPLVVGGQTVGAFCVTDARPRAWTPEEVEVLVELAASVQREVELRGAVAALAARTAEAEDAQRRAEAANRAKAEFLAVMSHELRTPLNAIGGYAELLELGIHGPVTPEQRLALGRMQQSQRHLLGLINRVLGYARVEAGGVTYDVVDVPVADAVAEAEALVAPQLRAKGLGYGWAAAPAGLTVRADREKLQQILLNLLSNAVKFTPARDGAAGRVDVSCTVAGGRVRLHVRDTGQGIAPDQLERVFEPFVQADAGSARAHGGVGLGLAISRDLARGMGGDLAAESAPGAGSTFTLTLPAGGTTT